MTAIISIPLSDFLEDSEIPEERIIEEAYAFMKEAYFPHPEAYICNPVIVPGVGLIEFNLKMDPGE